MKAIKYMDEERMLRKAIKALLLELGPVETNRFICMPRKKKMESVRRHKEWQKNLDKNTFFNDVFK